VASARRELLHVTQQREDQLAEKNATIKSYLSQNLRLVEEREALAARAAEAERLQRAAEAAAARAAQEKASLAQHNTWLEAELTAKGDSLLSVRRGASEEAMTFRTQLMEAQTKTAAAESRSAAATKRSEDLESKLEKAQRHVATLKSDLSNQKESFDKELTTANRLAELLKEKAAEAEAKVTELRGIVQALKEHQAEATATATEAAEAAEAARKSAVADAEAAREQLKRMTAAAALGPAAGGGGGASTAMSPLLASAASAAPATPNAAALEAAARPAYTTPEAAARPADQVEGLSVTALYSKYAETADALRVETAERRRLDKYLQQILQVRARGVKSEELGGGCCTGACPCVRI